MAIPSHPFERQTTFRSGFTLVEMLIGLAILSIALGTVHQSFAIGLRQEVYAERQLVATISAQSLLAHINVGQKGFGPIVGKAGGMAWTASIATGADLKAPAGPISIEVSVTWSDGEGGAVALRTTRMTSKANQ